MNNIMKATDSTIVHVIAGLNDGGAEAALFRLCKNDSKRLHVVISMMGMGKYGPLLIAEGIQVICLDIGRGHISFSAIIRLYKTIRSIQPDVVQTWMYHADLIGGIVARLAFVKNVVWGIRHSNLSFGTVKVTTSIIAKLCAYLSYFIPDKIVCCSTNAAYVHQSLGYCKKKFVIIPNGYDFSILTRNEDLRNSFRSSIGVPVDTVLVGMVARFDKQKDHKNLLDALKMVACSNFEFQCLLVGTGMVQENAQLNNWILEAGLESKITLLGQRSDVNAIMNALDIHILSSLGEAFPNVLAEAMACGTPCVTTDVGDASYIVGTSGWIASPGNYRSLANAIIKAMIELRDGELWKLKRESAREHVAKRFGISRVVEAYDKVWFDN